ncbi:hypothetical protein MKW94_026733 [Papaver nudicaule]|uniref:Uncharacterized protein n=1 Tax=Papaver nudicaule TaxID=74823 RepID=A0AA41RYR7_PAPNU|nr:hypothetical protein [Papaver nudicaule]
MNESGNFGLPYELPTANDGGNSFNNLDELPWGVLLLRQEEDPGSRQAVRKEITRRCPEFETKLNEDQSNLIHLASEYGYVDIVKVLLFISTIKGRMSPCYIFDKDSKSPLDYAAMKGNKEVIYELLDALSLLAITNDSIEVPKFSGRFFLNMLEYFSLSTRKLKDYLLSDSRLAELASLDQMQQKLKNYLFFFNLMSWASPDGLTREVPKSELLAETPRLSDDVHPEVYEALNKLFLSTLMITYCFRTEPLERFLGSDPLLFGALSSRSCPLQTQLNFCVLTRQTDDLLDEISKSRYALELAQGQDQENIFPMHNVSGWGLIHIVKLILIYESGSSSVCLLKNMDGNTPLHCAARTGEVGVINTLLSTCWECAGIVSDERNETALHCALTHKNAKAFKTLLEWYIIKEEFSHNTARDWECGDTSLDLLVDGYGKIVKELLCKKESMVCFQREFWEGKEYFVVIKFKNKGSTGTKYRDYIREVTSKITNRTIVSLSVDSRSIITLRVLIRSAMVRGILDVRDVDGNTVFDLLRNTIVRKTNVMGFVPYERFENVIWLLDAIQMGDYCVFSKIIVEDPEIRGYICELPLGGTPLHFSVRSGQLNDCTREIIRKMPHFAAWKDHKGRNPLHIASAKGYLEIVKELLTQYGFNQCFASTEADEDIYDEGQFQGTPLDHAIQRGQISVINELLSIWWKCAGVISRESDSALLRSALGSENFEAFKMLMERYIKDELLKAKEVDGNPMSDLADGYIDIVLKHLLNPKVDYSLSILLKNKDDGKKTCTKLPRPLYFAVIKVSSSSKRNDNNIVDELQLSAYYPKYFREVTIQNKMVLHLSIDDENSSVTLKLLLQSPLFYDSHVYGDDVFDGLYWAEVCHYTNNYK